MTLAEVATQKKWRRFSGICVVAILLLAFIARRNGRPSPNARGDNRSSSLAELTPQQIAGIDSYVNAEMAREHIPGAAVGVYRRGQILLAKGYGLANVELNVPVNAGTLFQSGSVGKQFVSAAMMMLVEEGKVGLDDSIVKYFPNAPATWQPIKIKNLLSHTSGLAEYESDERAGPKGPFYLRLDFTEDELLQKAEALPIEFAPGEKWAYRNTNYLLLGIMIHKVTGKFYADYLADRIFKPLGMTSTRLISEADIIPNRSSGYEWHGDKLQNQSWVSPTFNSTADGALYFNVLDLAKWDEALYGTTLLKQSSLDRIWTVFSLNDGKPNPFHYGFGWAITALNGHKLLEHDGAWQGFTCNISRYVDDTLTVVALTNLDSGHSHPARIAHQVAGLVNPALMPPPPKQHQEVKLDPKVFDAYVGRYELDPEITVTITREGGHLFAQTGNQPKAQLFPESERDYFLDALDAEITFLTDSSGRATELVLHQSDADWHAKRIP
jgi:CubicO group peptidase (beta-lactamase class C family)